MCPVADLTGRLFVENKKVAGVLSSFLTNCELWTAMRLINSHPTELIYVHFQQI